MSRNRAIVRMYSWQCTVEDCYATAELPYQRRWQAENAFLSHLRLNHPDEMRAHSEFIERIQELPELRDE